MTEIFIAIKMTTTDSMSLLFYFQRLHNLWWYQYKKYIHVMDTLTVNTDAHNLQSATGARPVPPVQPHDCWLLNPYSVTNRAAFGS